MKYSNNHNVPLCLAVWLAHDLYDHNDDPNTISVTTLMKPLKQIILSSRVPASAIVPDVSGLAASQMGTAMHTAAEVSWITNYKQSLESLGYPKRVIDSVLINPDPKDVDEDSIPIYMERRSSKQVGSFNVSGKFDFVAEGQVQDIKSTKVFSYIKKTNDEKYKLQGSIYRWLNQDIITEPTMKINFIFVDWKAHEFKADPRNYPPQQIMGYDINLMSITETQNYITNKVSNLEKLWGEPEASIPPCTPDDLWQDATKYKYFKKPDAKRATKNYDNAAEANLRLSQEGTGVVREVKGKVKACIYCDAFSVCKQKDAYLANGTLTV